MNQFHKTMLLLLCFFFATCSCYYYYNVMFILYHKATPYFFRTLKCIFVAEPSNLMPHRSAGLLLDTKHSRENNKLLGFVGHTPGENPKIHIFAFRITNERIKLTSFLTISYVTFNTTSEYNIYCYNNGM